MDDELLAVRVAELYYDENKTQDEIGALLHVSRWKVGRLLRGARARYRAHRDRSSACPPTLRRAGAARAVRAARCGRRAALRMRDERAERVAQAAADYLAALRPVPRTLGVSWGRTLDEVAATAAAGLGERGDVVQINGGVSLNRRAGTRPTPPPRSPSAAGAMRCCCQPRHPRAGRDQAGDRSRPHGGRRARARPRGHPPTCTAPESPTRARCSSRAAT